MNLEQPIIPDDHLFEQVNLGHKAEEFLKSDPLGRKLAEKAIYDYKNALYDFEALSVEVIFEHPAKVAAIKQRMDTAKSFLLWINTTVNNADRAEDELRNRDMSDETID